VIIVYVSPRISYLFMGKFNQAKKCFKTSVTITLSLLVRSGMFLHPNVKVMLYICYIDSLDSQISLIEIWCPCINFYRASLGLKERMAVKERLDFLDPRYVGNEDCSSY